MRKLFIVCIVLFFNLLLFGQENETGNRIILQNDEIFRAIVVDDGVFSTQSFRLKNYPFNFVSINPEEIVNEESDNFYNAKEYGWRPGPYSDEFSFLLNGELVTGTTGWKLKDVQTEVFDDGELYRIILIGDDSRNRDIELTVCYQIFSDLPLIRKKIEFLNVGSEEIKIESLDVEHLNIAWRNVHNIIYHNYARYKHIGPFMGDGDDPLVISHNPVYHHGIFIGNEAPGVLKRSTVCLDGRAFTAGLTMVGRLDSVTGRLIMKSSLRV